jgi:hypothetical protein
LTRGDGSYAVQRSGGLLACPRVSPIWAIARVPLSNPAAALELFGRLRPEVFAFRASRPALAPPERERQRSGGECAVAAARAAQRAALKTVQKVLTQGPDGPVQTAQTATSVVRSQPRRPSQRSHSKSLELGTTRQGQAPGRWSQSDGVGHPARPRPGQTPVKPGSPGTGLLPHGFAVRSSKRTSILRRGSHDRAVT